MKAWRKTKSGTRRGIYALMDTVDPVWWFCIVIVAGIVASVVWGFAGFWIVLGVLALGVVFNWLFVDSDSLESNTASLGRLHYLDNIAKSSHDNTKRDGHH